MATMIRIPIQEIINGEGKAIRTVVRDEDGDVVYKLRCEECERPVEGSEPALEPLTSLSAIRNIIYSLNGPEGRKVQKGDDGAHCYRVLAYLTDARRQARKNLRLPIGEHDWLARLFDRRIPLSKEAREEGVETLTLGEMLWGINAWAVWKQLTAEGLTPLEIPEIEPEDLPRDETGEGDKRRALTIEDMVR